MENLIITKRCSSCKQDQSTICFSPSKHSKDGLHNQCHSCKKAYRDANKDKIKASNAARYEALRADPQKLANYAAQIEAARQQRRAQDLEKERAKGREISRRLRAAERVAGPEAYRAKHKAINAQIYRKRIESDTDYLRRAAERSRASYNERRERLGIQVLNAERVVRYHRRKELHSEEVRKKNRERNKKQQEVYGERLRSYHRTYKKQKYATDPNFKLAKAMRRMVHAQVRGEGGLSLLPYTPSDLRLHLESAWREGMTWENWGTVWHIDHIKPIAVFLREGETDPAIVNALPNLQPLIAEENRQKGDRYSSASIIL